MLRVRTSLWMCVVCLGLTGAMAATPASAQQIAAGVQAGVSLDPDQVYFGGHVETSPLVERLRFRPNVEIGIGDDVTLIGINFEFTYSFTANRPWNVYVGAGPAINVYDFDDEANLDGGSETEAGFNFLVGARHRNGLFFEMKVGAMDSPDLKFGVGYTFR
jgi:hypothetical protein